MNYREYLKSFINKVGYGFHRDDSSVFKIQYIFTSKKEKPKLLDRRLSKIIEVHDDFIIIQSERRSRRGDSKYLTFSSTTAVPINRVIITELTKETQ
jgi:hypothetical protein